MDIEVKMGDLVVTKSPDNLMASGIGSCLVITLYDPKRKIGALAHSMLPNCPPSYTVRDASNPIRKTKDTKHKTYDTISNTQYEVQIGKYADVAIDEMLKRMKFLGAKREDLEAKLTGGANMFAGFESDIGKENFLRAKERLKKEGVKIVGESIGGSIGRSVEFSVASGILTVKVKF